MTSEILVTSTPDAPRAIGHYSQAVRVGNTLYCSGQIALDPNTGILIDGDIEAQAARALMNLRAVLQAADTDFENVLKTTIYLTDLSQFAKVNGAYSAAFGEAKPARVTVEVSRLPAGSMIQIDCIALIPGLPTA